MRSPLTLGAISVLALIFLPSEMHADPLSNYKWKKRIIVMTIAGGTKSTSAALKQNRSKIRDRDLIIVDISKNSAGIRNTVRPSAASLKALRSQLSLSGNETRFVLIGKDGGVKSRQKSELDLKKFFALIDTMPMRKQEMRRK